MAELRPTAVRSKLSGHMPVLDGVRGIAILMVLVLHFVGNTQVTNGFERVLVGVCLFGTYGVDLFFVLSGFLITGILIDSKTKSGYFKNFYARRALRIFPLYYGVLIALFVIAPLVPALRGPELEGLERDQWWAWLYGVNVLHAIRGKMTLPFIDHFWSLSVEEHFYFVWPFIVKVCDRRRLMVVSIVVALASVLSRALLVHQVGPVGTFVLTPFRLDTLCWGGFLAAYARGPDGMQGIWRRIVPGLAILFGVVLLSLAFNRFTGLGFEELRQIRSACFGMMLSALVVAPVVDPRGGPIVTLTSSAWLRSLGKYSYGLYVFHHFFSYYIVSRKTEFRVAEWVGSHTLAVFIQAAVAFAASLAVAVASFRLIESKFIAFKRLWEPKPMPAPATATAPEQVS